MKVPGNESSRAISLRSTLVSGSDKAREQIGQGPIGRFTPGSELAQEWKKLEISNKHRHCIPYTTTPCTIVRPKITVQNSRLT